MNVRIAKVAHEWLKFGKHLSLSRRGGLWIESWDRILNGSLSVATGGKNIFTLL